MKITFLGHAAFLLESQGMKIITDPFSPEIGLGPLDKRADLVTLSHENPKWHSHLESVRGDFAPFWGLQHLGENWDYEEISLESVLVWENLPADGPNAMIKITMENLRILHMGDCGHALDDETLGNCGEVDVLLAPAGGAPTLELDDLMNFIENLAPKIVIPMHFGVPNLGMELLGVEKLIEQFEARDVVVRDESRFDLKRSDLPRRTQLHVLRALRAMDD